MSSYQLIDSGNFQKLEQVGPFRLVRPAPSAVWTPQLAESEWKNHDARFERFENGQGEWKINNPEIKKGFGIDVDGITFNLKLTSFGHLGIFPEQLENWLELKTIISDYKKKQSEPFQVLNLFAYTGGSTLFCARAGAEVVHVDASEGSVKWARQNAESSKLADKPIRWMVDDVQAFVAREVRRERKYHGIILDPPSYGRGPKNQAWIIEEHLVPLLNDLKKLMAKEFSFILLSSHSPGYTPIALQNLTREFKQGSSCEFRSREMLLPSEGLTLPSGTSCLLINK